MKVTFSLYDSVLFNTVCISPTTLLLTIVSCIQTLKDTQWVRGKWVQCVEGSVGSNSSSLQLTFVFIHLPIKHFLCVSPYRNSMMRPSHQEKGKWVKNEQNEATVLHNKCKTHWEKGQVLRDSHSFRKPTRFIVTKNFSFPYISIHWKNTQTIRNRW